MSMGDGEGARVLKLRDGRLLDVFGARLGTDRTGLAGNDAEARFRTADIPPYVGPLPGGMPDGGAAFIFRGRLVREQRGAQGGVTVTDVGAMPGVTPVGLFGRDSSLMALALPVSLGVEAGLDATREGGQLSQPAGRLRSATIVVAEATAALSPEADGGLLQPDPDGPVHVDAGPDDPLVLAGGSFTLPVAAPPGTHVQLRVDEELTDTEVPQDGVAQLRVSTEDFEDGDEVPVALLAVTPAGQGYGGAWTVSIHTQPPSLSVTTPFAPLSSTSRSPGARRPIRPSRWMAALCRSRPTGASTRR